MSPRTVGVESGLYVPALVRGEKVHLLVDTGATDTVLSYTFFYEISQEKRLKLTTRGSRVRTADGSLLQTIGGAYVEVQVGRTTLPLNIVFGNIGTMEGILGMDFLVPTRGCLDFNTMELKINGEKVRCTGNKGEQFCARVVVEKTTIVPPGHEAIVPGQLTGKVKVTGLCIMEHGQRGEIADKGMVMARSLVTAGDEVLPIRVFNPGRRQCVLRKGTMAGFLTSVAEDEVEETRSALPEVEDGHGVPEHLADLFHRSKEGVDVRYHTRIASLLRNFQDVFSTGDLDIGRTGLVRHRIETGDARPIRERPRRYPTQEQQEISRQVQAMLQNGIIEPSDSPWASNVVLVRKKDGTKRFCVDYRRLNSVTIKDAYPIPRIDDSLDTLSGSRWFSTLDLASGYWQVELDDEAKQKAAFVVRGGLYPLTFERLMEWVLAGLHWETLLVYLDDVIVFARTVEEELDRLEKMFQRLRKAGLKLKPKKCELFKQSVLYLGHVVSGDGVTTDPEKIRAVEEWPTPKTRKEVQSFLGLRERLKSRERSRSNGTFPFGYARSTGSRAYARGDTAVSNVDRSNGTLGTFALSVHGCPSGVGSGPIA